MRKFIKKLILGIIVGVLLTTIISFGWNSKGLVFNAIKTPVAIDFRNFMGSLMAHLKLDDAILVAQAAGLNKDHVDDAFYEWFCNTYERSLFTISRYPNNGVTEGGLAFFEYNFLNNSDEPAYFKISKPIINLNGYPNLGNYTYFVAYYISPDRTTVEPWDFDREHDILLKDGHDGYYYSPMPIQPNEDVNIMFVSYFLGYEGLYLIPVNNLNLYVENAELIQATKQYTKVFAGTTISDKGTYQISYSGLLSGEFEEGEINLTTEQIADLNARGVCYNNIAGDSINANHSTIKTAKVIVKNGEIVSLIFTGNVKTKAGASESYTMNIDMRNE